MGKIQERLALALEKAIADTLKSVFHEGLEINVKVEVKPLEKSDEP